MVSRRSRGLDRPTTRPSVRPSVHSFVHPFVRSVSQVERYHGAERVHRCRVSNIDRTGMHYGVTQEEAVGDYGGAAAAPGMAGTEPGAHRLHYRTEPKAVYDHSTRGSRALVAMSLLPSSFLFPFLRLARPIFPAPIIYPRYTPLHPLLVPISLPPLPACIRSLACLSLVYGLLFANSAPTIDASRLIANPSSVYPPYLIPLTRAVNEIHAQDINRHSLRSR